MSSECEGWSECFDDSGAQGRALFVYCENMSKLDKTKEVIQYCRSSEPTKYLLLYIN